VCPAGYGGGARRQCIGVARNLSWGTPLMPEGPKFDAGGRERGIGSWAGGSEPLPTS